MSILENLVTFTMRASEAFRSSQFAHFFEAFLVVDHILNFQHCSFSAVRNKKMSSLLLHKFISSLFSKQPPP
ncbi:hypothetical protein SCG7086_CO_00070 [Chlamydiales bacterium SCGC AG-110-P3]|nr:hypothetical protein SCG7086_CO_00070 [Chlamydiales bacterium SCGC AG-110-P3]